MNTQVLDATHQLNGGFKVDVTRGEHVGRVSSEWFSRPEDERFLSLNDLKALDRGAFLYLLRKQAYFIENRLGTFALRATCMISARMDVAISGALLAPENRPAGP